MPQHGNEKGTSPPGVQERLIKLQRALAVLAECQPFGLLQMSGFLAPDECAAIIAMAVGAVAISAAAAQTSKPYCDRSKAAPCMAKGATYDVESCWARLCLVCDLPKYESAQPDWHESAAASAMVLRVRRGAPGR